VINFFDNVTTIQVVALIVFMLLILLSAVLKIGRVFGYVSTIVHEFGHALVAKMLGEKVAGFKLNYDTSGETLVFTTGRRVSTILVGLSGYPAPIIFGAFGVLTVFYNMTYLFLIMFFLIGLTITVMIRNFFAVIPVFIVWGAIFIAIIVGEVAVTMLTIIFSIILVFFGVKDLLHLWRVNPPFGDAHMLSVQTSLNSKTWMAVMFSIVVLNITLLVVFSNSIFGNFAYIYEQWLTVFGKISAIY
jgi:hypothetical protein